MRSQRKLKVSTQSRAIGKYYTQWKTAPKVILQGDWLQDAGFNIGESVKVTVRNNEIVISNQERAQIFIADTLTEFNAHLNNLHYEGYAEQLVSFDYATYEYLFNDFKNTYAR